MNDPAEYGFMQRLGEHLGVPEELIEHPSENHFGDYSDTPVFEYTGTDETRSGD